MSQSVLDAPAANNNDDAAEVAATVSLQGNGTKRVSIVGSAATAEQLLQLAADSLGVSINLTQVSIVANGTQADATTPLSGTENFVAAAPRHANG